MFSPFRYELQDDSDELREIAYADEPIDTGDLRRLAQLINAHADMVDEHFAQPARPNG